MKRAKINHDTSDFTYQMARHKNILDMLKSQYPEFSFERMCNTRKNCWRLLYNDKKFGELWSNEKWDDDIKGVLYTKYISAEDKANLILISSKKKYIEMVEEGRYQKFAYHTKPGEWRYPYRKAVDNYDNISKEIEKMMEYCKEEQEILKSLR